MKYFLRAIVSNMYKTVHTKILWVHILMPLVGIGLAGSYLVYSSWTETEKIISYVQLLAAVFPLMAAVVVTMTYETDLRAGKFQNLLFVPCSKIVSYFGNLLSLLILGMAASILAVVGFGVFLILEGHQLVPLSVYMMVGSYLFATNIAVYLLQYMICYTWGKSISMGVGILGVVLSVLLAMGMGDEIWKYCLHSYGIRCSSYLLFRILKPEIYRYIIEEHRIGLSFVIGITVLLFLAFCFWSFRWQGTRENEE